MRIKLNESHLKKGNFSASYCEYSFGLLIAGQNMYILCRVGTKII